MSTMNIKTLARELKLSVSTVSKALRDSYEISQETKEKVIAAAKKMNYVPNPYASSLRKRKSKTIAVVLPEVADSFFSQAINGIDSIAQDKGYHVLIYLTHENFIREQEILNEFKSGRVDGILVSVTQETPDGQHIGEAVEAGIPVVFFDRVCSDIETARVVTDDFESGYRAATHLVEVGCRNIYFLAVSPSLSISNARLDGVRKALGESGTPFSDRHTIICTAEADSNRSLVRDLLAHDDRPDGIIASVEKLTTPVYLACRDLSLNIPRDVKVISFTNLQTAQILDPPLTTITQPAFEMGRRAATVLFGAIGKPNATGKQETIVIPSVLTVRGSTQEA